MLTWSYLKLSSRRVYDRSPPRSEGSVDSDVPSLATVEDSDDEVGVTICDMSLGFVLLLTSCRLIRLTAVSELSRLIRSMSTTRRQPLR